MPMKRDLIILTQRPGASTPKDLKNALDCRRLPPQRTRETLPVPRGSLVVNWGGSRYPDWAGSGVVYLNDPEAVRRKTSKVGQIRRFVEAGVPTLEVTTDLNTVREWRRNGSRVLCRQDGSFGGRGITVVEPDGGAIPEGGDFYSRYFPKTHEYRVHVFNPRAATAEAVRGGRPGVLQGIDPQGVRAEAVQPLGIIDIAQKKRANNRLAEGERVADERRTLHQRVVRSYENGWIFAHDNLHLPEPTRVAVSDAAIHAVAALGLDFGAVDVLVQHSRRTPERLLKLAVAEVNTAPGVECTRTLQAYVDAIRGVYESRQPQQLRA